MNKDSKIYIAGHRGLVGSAIVRNLEKKGFENIIYRTRKELDLTNQEEVRKFFEIEKPEYVFLAAAKVGGIHANNTYPVEFLYENLMIQNNVIKAATEVNIKKLLFLGSSCIYPKSCTQPMTENQLLSGKLEQTNEGYALAKIAGIKLCEYYKKEYKKNYISCMPTNVYGEGDNFDIESSHVIPGLIRKFHNAKISESKNVKVWGTGKAKREFLYVDDLAEACIFLMKEYNDKEFINVGTGIDISISDLAQKIAKIVGYTGEIVYEQEKLEGNLRKLLDVGKMKNMGWESKIDLEEGITKTYKWYLENVSEGEK